MCGFHGNAYNDVGFYIAELKINYKNKCIFDKRWRCTLAVNLACWMMST